MLTQVIEPRVLAARVPRAVSRATALVWDKVRELLETFGGRPVQTGADGLMAIFGSPAAAARFCIAVQDQVMDLAWPATLTVHPEAADVHSATGELVFRGLRVRQAMHVGLLDCRKDSAGDEVYYGPAVHQVARIASVGHGGQVLLSEAAWRKLGLLPDDGTLRDLGGHRLPGVHGIVRLFLILPDRADAREFPPLRTLDRHKTNLVHAHAPLLGRAGDIAALSELMGFGVRLLTVTGPEGAGKTRLVRQFAERNLDWFGGRTGGGVWFCDLAGARDVDGLVWAIARALGIPITMDARMEASIEQVGNALSARNEVMLVLDGVDAMRDALARVLPMWVEQASQCRFLITCRRRLEVPGEVAYDLATFDPGPSPFRQSDPVRLFEARAKATDPTFQLDDLDSVHALVTRLVGNPMLIELAATTVGQLTPAELLARLPDSGVRALVRSLGEVCWGQLDLTEQVVLVRCSVFLGWFGLHGAEVMVDHTMDIVVPDVLEQLVQRGLVRTDEFGDAPGIRRYSLHPRIREFAWYQMDQAERKVSRRRHADFLLRLTEGWLDRIWRHEGPEVGARIALEWTELMGIHARAVRSEEPEDWGRSTRAVLVLDPLLERRGPLATRHRLLDEAIRASDSLIADPILQVRVLEARARSRSRTEADRAQLEFERALAVARRWSDREGVALCTYGIGRILWNLGDTDRARSMLEEAAQSFKDQGDLRREGQVIGTLGVLHMEAGRLADAVDHLHLSIDLLREAGARHAEAVVVGNLAVVNRRMGSTDEARVLYREALRIHESTGYRRHGADITSNLGVLDYHLGRLDEARAHYEDALAVCRELGHKKGEAVCLGNLGLVAAEHGDTERGRSLLLQAMALHRDLGETAGEGTVAGYLGLLHHRLGEVALAREFYERATRMLDRVGNKRFRALFTGWRALVDAESGELRRAETLFDLAHIELAMAGDPPMQKALEVLRSSLDLARARAIEVRGDAAKAASLRQAVLDHIDAIEAGGLRSGDLRLALHEIRGLAGVPSGQGTQTE